MKKLSLIAGLAPLLALSPALTADDGLEFHDDYYLGFSQGAYYGLMLAGVDYNVALVHEIGACLRGSINGYRGSVPGED